MNKILLPLLLFFSLTAIPLKAQLAPFPHFVFHAELSGSEAIPAVVTEGKALITLLYTPDRTKVEVSGLFVRLEGTVTEAKIRIGKTGQTGPVLLDLLPLINGRHVVGQLNAPPELLQNLLPDGVYAEIKTTAHPNGEIRGQFICETDVDYGVSMSGDQLVPASGSQAIAFGAIHYPLGAEDLVYAFTTRGLSSPITGVEIYEGAPGTNGVLVETIPKPLGSFIQGLMYLDTMPIDFVRRAREGKYYIVVKTSAFPNGEVRGHINHLGYFASLSPINGAQQVPPQISPGFGFNHTMHNPTLDSLSTLVFVNTIIPTSVKVHIGLPMMVGPEFVTLDPLPIAGFFFKKYKVTEAQLTDFAQGRLYINVATIAKPNGEIRGVMKNTLRKAYAFDLCGIQMVPPTNSSALGIAVASVDQANCYINYKIIFDGLASFPSVAYIADGDFGMFDSIVHIIQNIEPIMHGAHEIMAALGPVIEAGGTFMQISSNAYPDGEIRGQIRRGFTCPEVVAVSELDQIGKVLVSPVPFQDVLNVELESKSAFEGRIVMYDMMGIPVLAQTVGIVSGEQGIQMETGYLPVGVYTISLEIPSEHASVLLKKVVKVE